MSKRLEIDNPFYQLAWCLKSDNALYLKSLINTSQTSSIYFFMNKLLIKFEFFLYLEGKISP